jgi:hypothetical protein
VLEREPWLFDKVGAKRGAVIDSCDPRRWWAIRHASGEAVPGVHTD